MAVAMAATLARATVRLGRCGAAAPAPARTRLGTLHRHQAPSPARSRASSTGAGSASVERPWPATRVGSVSVSAVPMFEDNYCYLCEWDDGLTAAVDPAEAAVVAKAVRDRHSSGDGRLHAILTTHKHWDHAGGNEELAQMWPDVQVLGPKAEEEHIPRITRAVEHGEVVSLGDVTGSSATVRVLSVPCHTSGHCMYLLEQAGERPILFSGDTIFVGGCGRFFEGDASDWLRILELVEELPKETLVFCGHEYTTSNLAFARHCEPDNADTAEASKVVDAWRADGLPSVPTTLGDQYKTNPFFRAHPGGPVARALGLSGSHEEIVAHVRALKDNFRG